MIDDDVKARTALNRMGTFVAGVLIFTLLVLVLALIFIEIPAPNQQALLIVIGGVLANVGTLINWFFGTSVATKKKDETIATMADTQKSAQAALAPLPGAPGNEIPVQVGEKVTVKAVEEP